MSHANPSGDLAVLVERALDLLVDKLKARRFGETKRARRTRPRSSAVTPSPVKVDQPSPTRASLPTAASPSAPPTTRPVARPHVSHESRRQVLARDGLRCSYVSSEGRRCSARAFLELDHAKPWAKGGGNSSDNLRVFCRGHNQLLAELAYGKVQIQAAVAARK
jgi:hypothetical protein